MFRSPPSASASAASSAAAGRLRESDSVNSLAIHHIDASAIDRVFTGSANLDEKAIIDFVSALRQISEVELSNAQQPRVFALQKIVEITSYNMGRIRLVWNRIWAIISEYFIKAGCLTGDHMVLTRSGWRSIATLRPNDTVASLNVETWAMEWKRVTATQHFKVEARARHHHLFRMQGDGLDVVATRDHRMLTAA